MSSKKNHVWTYGGVGVEVATEVLDLELQLLLSALGSALKM
jgi:hypothetical protein